MKWSVPSLAVVALAMLGPSALAAQSLEGATVSGAWPSSWAPPDTLVVAATPQERRLPVYDDAGQIISFEEIQARVDPDGTKGFLIGGLVGFVAGAAIGDALTGCGERKNGFQYYCSDKGEALQSRLPVALGVTVGLLFGWVGFEADRTTWDEVVEDIRAERRLAR